MADPGIVNYVSGVAMRLYKFFLCPSAFIFWFSKCTTPWMFVSLDNLLEYWIEHVSFGLLYVMFTFPTRIFYRGVQGFATDCPCGVLVPRINHLPPVCWSTNWKSSLKMILCLSFWPKGGKCCSWLFHILMPYNILYFRLPYFCVSNIVFNFLHSTSVQYSHFYIDVVLTLSINKKLKAMMPDMVVLLARWY